MSSRPSEPAHQLIGLVWLGSRNCPVLLLLTVSVVVDELLVGSGSGVVLLTVAVLLITVPLATLGFIVTMIWMVSEWPLGKVAMVSLTALPMWLRLNMSMPAVWLCDTKVSL